MLQRIRLGLIYNILARFPWLVHLPPFTLGLFLGRVLSEVTGLPAIPGLLLSVVMAGILIYLVRRQPLHITWPFMWLAGYALYPWQTPAVAATFAGLSLLTILIEEKQPRLKIRIWAIVIFCSFVLLYSWTAGVGVLPADSGEFQLVAAQFGVAHPPGFPLYTMIAGIFAHLPLPVSVPARISLLSAIISAATLILNFITLRILTGRNLPGILAALALGTSTTFWAQAGIANIRSLTAFFAALIILGLVLALEKPENQERKPKSIWALLLFPLALSFGITHHASLAFMGLVFMFGWLSWRYPLLRKPRRWPPFILAGLAGLLPLLYLPLRARAGALGAPPGLTSWTGFWDHVLARGFSGDFFYFMEPAMLRVRLFVMAEILAFQFTPLLLAAIVIGLIIMLRARRRLALVLLAAFLVHTFITATYRAPQSVEYMMPAYVILALFLGYAAEALSGWPRTVFVSILFVAAFQQGIANFASYNGQERVTEEKVIGWLHELPQNATVLANWHYFNPLRYLQLEKGIRQDASIHYVAPTGEPYAVTWANRIQAELDAGNAVLATFHDPDTYAPLPNPVPMFDAWLFSPSPRFKLPDGFADAETALSSNVTLHGYRQESTTLEIGQETSVLLAWSALAVTEPYPFYLHLVGPANQIVAQADLSLFPVTDGMTFNEFIIGPHLGTTPGKYTLMVGAEDGERQPVASLFLASMEQPLFTSNPIHAQESGGGRTLIGYDWDTTLPGRNRLYLHLQGGKRFFVETIDDPATPVDIEDLTGPWNLPRTLRLTPPASAHYIPFAGGIIWRGGSVADMSNLIPGERLLLPLHFASSNLVLEDWVVSVRLVGYEDDGFHWAWWDLHDFIPATGAIPTLKWIGGSEIVDPHFLDVSPQAEPGQQIEALVDIYDAFSRHSPQILDERLDTIWIPTGTTTLP